MIVGIRLVEIIFDPIIGGIVDNTRTRWENLSHGYYCWAN